MKKHSFLILVIFCSTQIGAQAQVLLATDRSGTFPEWLIYHVLKRDKDGDSIKDKKDQCPDVAGLPAHDGCPDSDRDGIRDIDDACPLMAGLAQFQGCPDTDNDGIIDSKDACPTIPGLVANNGCPDNPKSNESKDKSR